SQLLSLRRRLQHLCGQLSGGRAGDEWYQGLPRGGLASAHQRTEECRGTAVWERKFLGYTVSVHRETRLRIAPESARRLADKVRELMRAGRGRSLAHTIKDLNPVLRGW